MAIITRYPFLTQARVEAASFLAVFRQGRLVRSGRGIAAWFATGGPTSLVEIPADDRDHVLNVSATTADFQTVSALGLATWRTVDPVLLSGRIDFTVEPKTGQHRGEPIAQVESLIDGLVASAVERFVAARTVAQLLDEGIGALLAAVEREFAMTGRLAAIGIEIAGIRLTDLSPAPELVRALRQPTIEKLQQGADEATFARRAAAVEKEAAIAENETRAKIRLEDERGRLIAKERDNELARAHIAQETARIEAEGEAHVREIQSLAAAAALATSSEAEARALERTDAVRLATEQARAEIAKGLPPVVTLAHALETGLAAAKIGTLNLGPDAVGLIGQTFAKAVAGKT